MGVPDEDLQLELSLAVAVRTPTARLQRHNLPQLCKAGVDLLPPALLLNGRSKKAVGVSDRYLR